jgi:hypothetical protein
VATGGKALAQPLFTLSRGNADWHGNAWLGSRAPARCLADWAAKP